MPWLGEKKLVDVQWDEWLNMDERAGSKKEKMCQGISVLVATPPLAIIWFITKVFSS